MGNDHAPQFHHDSVDDMPDLEITFFPYGAYSPAELNYIGEFKSGLLAQWRHWNAEETEWRDWFPATSKREPYFGRLNIPIAQQFELSVFNFRSTCQGHWRLVDCESGRAVLFTSGRILEYIDFTGGSDFKLKQQDVARNPDEIGGIHLPHRATWDNLSQLNRERIVRMKSKMTVEEWEKAVKP